VGREGKCAPTGCTARPRVQDEPIMTLVCASGEPSATEYAL
jgi:hypothetical protein